MNKPLENEHYELVPTAKSYKCLACGKIFPCQYHPKQHQSPGKQYGTKQLLKLWAWYNFKKHLIKCWSNA